MTSRSPLSVSLVVPAHDEAALIGPCLRTVLAGWTPGAVAVHVVVNASTDDTAERARAVGRETGHSVDVLETAEAGKVPALRLGTTRCAAGPRVYLDADVLLAGPELRALATALDTPEVRVAAPALRIDSAASGPLVRAFYRVWTALPYTGPAMVGSGVYGLSAAAAERLGEMPAVTNDDGYVLRLFGPGERVTSPGSFTVRAPRTVRALVARRARIHNGNRQLDELGLPAPQVGQPAALGSALRRGTVRPWDAAAFVGLTVAARVLATWRRRRGRAYQWSTDPTTRTEGTT